MLERLLSLLGVEIADLDERFPPKEAFAGNWHPVITLRDRELFDQYYLLAQTLLRSGLVLPALDYCLKCSHAFNLMDASGGIGVTERKAYILKVRQLAVAIARRWAGLEDDGQRPDASTQKSQRS